LALTFLSCQPAKQQIDFQNDAHRKIAKVLEVTGDMEDLLSMKDVNYRFTSKSPEGKEDVSQERYIFENETSWACYLKHEAYIFPQVNAELCQMYDGNAAFLTFNGDLVHHLGDRTKAQYHRRTNYHFFTLMQKLLDPGISYKDLPDKELNGIKYDVVEITLQNDMAKRPDTYHLFINPKTKLVDQILFTVMTLGLKQPQLMLLEYEKFEKVMIPTRRKVQPSNWNATVMSDNWTEERCTDIRFNNNYDTKSIVKKDYL
jgi:hypothetical protein